MGRGRRARDGSSRSRDGASRCTCASASRTASTCRPRSPRSRERPGHRGRSDDDLVLPVACDRGADASATAWRAGARSCSPACIATRRRPPISSTCRPIASSSSAPRCRFEPSHRRHRSGHAEGLPTPRRHAPRSASSLAALTLGAIGVVYGDIGTSPLYALKQVFANGHVPLTPHNIYGVLSLVFWTFTVIVSIKYVVLILRADNNGEGGLIAMLALASQAVRDRPKLRRRLLFVGIFGTAIFFGDGVITPAISVLGAVEGLPVAAPAPAHLGRADHAARADGAVHVPAPRHERVGKLFGPVMVVWFVVIAALGLAHIGDNPSILKALSPHYALAVPAEPAARSRSSRSARSCCASPAPRRSMPTWATSASGRSASPGSAWRCRR